MPNSDKELYCVYKPVVVPRHSSKRDTMYFWLCPITAVKRLMDILSSERLACRLLLSVIRTAFVTHSH